MPGKNVKDVIGEDAYQQMNYLFTSRGIAGFIPSSGSVCIPSQKLVVAKKDSPADDTYMIDRKIKNKKNDTHQMADSLLTSFYEWYFSYAKEVFDKLDAPE